MNSFKSNMLFFFTLILLHSCGPKNKDLAMQLVNDAEVALSQTKYNVAKLKIDSINLLYPDEIDEIAAGKRLIDKIELVEQEQTLSYFDTLLVKRQAEFDKLVKSFVYKKGKFDGYAATYTHKRQQISNSHDRSYIRAYLDDKGEFYISSRFHGKGRIHHDRVKVYNDGLFAETESIPESSFDNRAYDDGEDYWETVNYRNGTDNDVVSFIVNNYDKTLKVQFKGKKYHYIVMESFDKEAVRDSYNLSLVIKEIIEVKKNIANANERISQLEKVIAASAK